jgi:hypothetical protein
MVSGNAIETLSGVLVGVSVIMAYFGRPPAALRPSCASAVLNTDAVGNLARSYVSCMSIPLPDIT